MKQDYLLRIQVAWLRRAARSRAGARELLNLYYRGEASADRYLGLMLKYHVRDSWLCDQLRQHLLDEARHAKLFAQQLRRYGATPARVSAEEDYIEACALRPVGVSRDRLEEVGRG